jgi:molybdate transport system permease protein
MTAGSVPRFYIGLGLFGGLYLALILARLFADTQFTSWQQLWTSLQAPEIRYAIRLSLMSCLVTTILSLWFGVPTGYLLSRTRFWGKPVIDTLLDIPIVLPPLVLGLSLLILFQTQPGKWLERMTSQRMGFMVTYFAIPLLMFLINWVVIRTWSSLAKPLVLAIGFGAGLATLVILLVSGLDRRSVSYFQERLGTPITYAIPSVILAQFTVSCAFAIRTMRVAFDQISPRTEQVALTLGCTRSQAFWLVSIPEAWRGIVSAAAIAFARSLGEFGPILIFSGATRMRTEVLSTTVFLELSVGKLEAAIAVSLLMVLVAVVVLLLMRFFGLNRGMM